MTEKKTALMILRQVVLATTIVLCALPGIVFAVVAADPVSRSVRDMPTARNAWEVVATLDYFAMIMFSPFLVPLMWFVRWTARASFVPPAKAALTFIAVCGTIGAAYFWVRLFS